MAVNRWGTKLRKGDSVIAHHPRGGELDGTITAIDRDGRAALSTGYSIHIDDVKVLMPRKITAALVKGGCEVRRNNGKRARTEVHFWGMVRDELNESYQGEYRYVWTLTRPVKNHLTSMPYALHRPGGEQEMLIDQHYATRDVRALYNAGEKVFLARWP